VRLASLNLLNGTSLEDGAVRPDRLVASVQELRADVVGLQEVDRGQPRSHGADLTACVAEAMGAEHWRFVPALTGAATGAVRACARPLSADGLPLLGRAPGRDDVFVAAGHGPWGISLGPASARLVAELVLEGGPGPPPEFDPARFR